MLQKILEVDIDKNCCYFFDWEHMEQKLVYPPSN